VGGQLRAGQADRLREGGAHHSAQLDSMVVPDATLYARARYRARTSARDGRPASRIASYLGNGDNLDRATADFAAT
jgi:hypothetical protein